MTTPAARMFRDGILQRLRHDDSSRPCRFRLPCLKVIVDNELRLRRCHVARSQEIIPLPHQEKVILLTGETGTGKTTLINSLVNYYYRTQWDDEFRLVLIAEEDEGDKGAIRSQSESQTSWITAYTLYWKPDCAVSYTLTLIDTPGYHDPRGVQYDTKTTEKLSKFFNLSGSDAGIDQIDGVGFVVTAAQRRLTSEQRYVYHSVLSIFGADIKDNIVLMVTNVDNQTSTVGEAASAGGIPFRECFMFNNSVLFNRNKKKKSQGKDQNEDDDDICVDKVIWKRNMTNTDKFFRILNNLEPKSLKLTKEVLCQRQRLHLMLENNKEEISDGLTDLINLRKENEFLEHYSSTLNVAPTVAKRYIESRKLQRIVLPNVECATNCDSCQRTCHHPCTLKTEELWRCQAMNYHYYETMLVLLNVSSPRSTNCSICPGKCPASSHSSGNFRYNYIPEKRLLTFECIQENHQEEGESLLPEELSLRIENESAKERVKVYRLLMETNSIILRLDEIALKPQSLEISKLMQTMIDEAEQSGDTDWKDRVDQLKRLLVHDNIIQEIKRRFAS